MAKEKEYVAEQMKQGSSCRLGKKAGGPLKALILGLGIAWGGFFPGYFYYQTHYNNNTVTVKGLAEMNVKADLAVWDIKFVTTNNSLPEAQKKIEAQKQLVISFLLEQGFTREEIQVGRLETNDLDTNPYRDKAATSRYILNQYMVLKSSKVDSVEKALSSTAELVAKGVIFDNQYSSPVAYIFTHLNEIKPAMLEEATKNARQAAAEFAKSADSKVGKIRRAQQGVFSILPQDQTPGASESNQINKKVRVVSTVEYWLE